jgi:HlyD family secretion protein
MPIGRSLIAFAAVALIAPLAFFGYQANAPEAATGGGGGEANYDFYALERGDVEAVVSAVGEIEADETVDLSLTMPGRVVEVFVKETDYLREGDVLIRLENDNQRIAYDEAVLGLELAEIELADLKAPVDPDNVRIAEANVEAARKNYRGASSTASAAEIDAARLEYEKAQRSLEATYDRRQRGGEFDTQMDVDLADAQIGSASFNAEIARLRLEDLKTGDYAGANAALLNLRQAEAELERVLAGPTDLEIEQAEVRVEQAQARLESAETALGKTELRAPFDGYVSLVNVEPGVLIAPGIAIAQMVDVEPLRVTVQVDEIDIGLIEPGMAANVEVDALPNAMLSARLAKLALVGTQTEGGIVNYDAEIELAESDPVVRVGMTAEANIIVSKETNVLRVPNAFIRLDRRKNEAFAERLNPETNEFEEVPISLGLRGENYSQVIDGLVEGDIIRADLTGNQFELFGG